jgi:lipopolysaccharide transport system ATP-binding protein
MVYIKLKNVGVDFPIYNTTGRSLKNQLMQAATGGLMGSNERGLVVVRALQDVSLEVQAGDRVGILGHNGAGKSTLLRVITGVYEPTGGSVAVNGRVSSLIDINLGMDSEATGIENIYLRGALLGYRRHWLSSKINEIVDFAGLGDFIHMPLRTYSTGMQMRLAFSIATLQPPEVLVMDEWLSVGDTDFRSKAEEKLVEFIKKTSILILASNSLEPVKKICNRAITLEHGSILEE